MTEKKLCVYEIEDVFKTYDLLTHGTGFYSYISDKIRELRQSGHEGTKGDKTKCDKLSYSA